jgi:TRAP transporter T-component
MIPACASLRTLRRRAFPACPVFPRGRTVALLVASLALTAGCSLRQLAVDAVGDALATGGSVYETDADFALVGDALPFSVKLMDSLVAESPRHRGLLLAASRAYLLYAWGYVGFRADELARVDVEQANAARRRVRALATRSFDYAMRAVEIAYPGVTSRLARDPAGAARTVDRAQDVELLHAAMASLGLAIGNAKQDAAMLARLPEVEALLGQGLALDEAWNAGALHEFAVAWYAARPGLFDRAAVERHYARALALSRGTRAGLYVAYAEGAIVRDQDRRRFEALLDEAIAVDPDARPEERLQNALAKRRAQWLRGQAELLFVD